MSIRPMGLRRAVLVIVAVACVASSDSLGQSKRGQRKRSTTAPSPALASNANASALRAEFERAVRAGDEHAMLDALSRLFSADGPGAAHAAHQLLKGGAAHHRPIAVAALARYATCAELDAVVSDLNPSQYRDERRYLVRALGGRAPDDALRAAQAFLRDTDPCVQAAAIAAMTDHGRLAVLGLLVARLPPPPVNEARGAVNENDFMLAATMYGAVRALTGLRPASSSEVATYWNSVKSQVDARTPATDAEPNPQGRYVPANGVLRTDRLTVVFNPVSLQSAVAHHQKLKTPQDWQNFARALDAAVEDAQDAAEAILGATHMPYVELRFADARTIAATGGISHGYGGFGGGTRMTVSVDAFRPAHASTHAWRPLLTHEYVHVIHSCTMPGAPRWLSEGLACSLAESGERSRWTAFAIDRAKLRPLLGRGGVSLSTAWVKDAGGGAGEQGAYHMSHVVVDYLRFGGFTAPEARLACLLGRTGRGEPAPAALQAVYGLTVADLDRGLAAWVEDLPAR